MERKFERRIDSLENIYQFIIEFTTEHQFDEKTALTINLVVEELFTNMVKYNPGNTNDISISLSKKSDKIIISIIDYDVEPFDIRKTEEYDLKKTLEERRVGGLGIPLVKTMMDEIDYEYKDRQSKIILVKYLEDDHVQH